MGISPRTRIFHSKPRYELAIIVGGFYNSDRVLCALIIYFFIWLSLFFHLFSFLPWLTHLPQVNSHFLVKMSERKVINKYYPIDYDPSKLKRVKRPKDRPQQVKVRIALPMNITCANCGYFMARGSKFNSRKETVVGEAYLGQNVFRFYFRCKRCFQELTIKTDPRISDYVAEHNCKAGYVHHKASMDEEKAEEAEKEDLEQFDKMKALELKSLESMREAEINEAIDTVLTMHAQRQLIGVADLHQRALDCTIAEIDSEDEFDEEELAELHAMQQNIALRSRNNAQSTPHTEGDDDEDDEDPIALRTKQVRERMLQMQRDNINLPKEDPPQPSSSDSKTETDPSNGNLKSSPSSSQPSLHTTSTPSSSTTLASLSKTTFKMPLAKPVPSTNSTVTSASNIVSVSTPTASTPSSLVKAPNKPLLTASKYRRDDDDE